jgi:putative ABC transport system substrate-binding protein
MRRREFLGVLGGAAAWPFAGSAQEKLPAIGFLNSTSPAAFANFLRAIHQGLNETGYEAGRNAAIEYRWAEDRYDRLPALAGELVHMQVRVILATGAPNVPIAAKAATSAIPIVFGGGYDPVALGLVASLNRPGGNITGVTFLSNALEAKRLGLLRIVVPGAKTIAALMNPRNAGVEIQLKDLNEAARVLGLRVTVANATSDRDFEPAFASFVQQGADALIVGTDNFLTGQHKELVALAARHSIPAVYANGAFTSAGGLMSYGANIADTYREAGVYAGRILKGEKPSNLPVMQATKFELIINLKTAKAIGLTVPDGLVLAADAVIE